MMAVLAGLMIKPAVISATVGVVEVQDGWSTRQVDHDPSSNRLGTTERDRSGVWRPGGTGRAWRTASDSGSEANVHAKDADAVGARSAQGPAPTRKARATSSSEANVSSTYDHDARSPSLESRSRTSGGAIFLRKNKRNVSTPLPRPKPTQVLCPYAAAAGLALPGQHHGHQQLRRKVAGFAGCAISKVSLCIQRRDAKQLSEGRFSVPTVEL